MRPRWIAVTLIAMLLLAPALGAQEAEKGAKTISFVGPEILCHILHNLNLKPLATIEDAADDPRNTIIVVLGKPQVLAEIRAAVGGLKRFTESGGNLLIATDALLIDRDLPIRVTGLGVRATKENGYRGEPDCPRLTISGRDDIEALLARRHPLFNFLRKGIATNCPSNLEIQDRDAGVVELLSFGLDLTYIAGSSKDAPPDGRALYIAGNGMFMNGMMVQTDNDNFDFTVNAFRWLRESSQGTARSRVLLVVDGEVITTFDMKLTPPVPPIPLPPVRMLDRLMRGLENEHLFHQMLRQGLGEWRERFIGVVLGITTLLLLVYGAKKFVEGRHHQEVTVPQLLLPQGMAASNLPIEQKIDLMIRKDDFWLESRHLVLDWFNSEFDVAPDRWRAQTNAAFRVNDGSGNRKSLQRQADDVLLLARSAKPARRSRHQFFVLVETLRELSRALKDGGLALLVEGKNVRQG